MSEGQFHYFSLHLHIICTADSILVHRYKFKTVTIVVRVCSKSKATQVSDSTVVLSMQGCIYKTKQIANMYYNNNNNNNNNDNIIM